MGQVKVILPAMGEGVFEATITQWLVNEGDIVEEDDALVEIATDKVDTEVPAPVSGILSKIVVKSDKIAKINQVIAIIETELVEKAPIDKKIKIDTNQISIAVKSEKIDIPFIIDDEKPNALLDESKFLSPLVRSIITAENISDEELSLIKGTGLKGRITKDDILDYISHKPSLIGKIINTATDNMVLSKVDDEIIEMDRMRKIIAERMVASKQISPHVTSFHEVDVTNIVKWRDSNKDDFLKRYDNKLTYTPIFIEAVVKAIKKYPLINVSVEGDNIILKKDINIGVATALPNGNLIVPVIHNADSLSLSAIAIKVNDLASRARSKQLQSNEVKGGTFTITNVGSFGNLTGTPIINQPEVAILAVGTIKKRPAVIETPQGDFIGIRHQMILSLSYDHRVVDGALGGMFLKQIADNMENFSTSI